MRCPACHASAACALLVLNVRCLVRGCGARVGVSVLGRGCPRPGRVVRPSTPPLPVCHVVSHAPSSSCAARAWGAPMLFPREVMSLAVVGARQPGAPLRPHPAAQIGVFGFSNGDWPQPRCLPATSAHMPTRGAPARLLTGPLYAVLRAGKGGYRPGALRGAARGRAPSRGGQSGEDACDPLHRGHATFPCNRCCGTVTRPCRVCFAAMHIKEVTICGFKTYRDATTVSNFHRGYNVVGR